MKASFVEQFSVADRVDWLIKQLETRGLYEKALEVAVLNTKLNDLVDAEFPLSGKWGEDLLQKPVISHDIMVLEGRERYREQLYDRYIRPYQIFLLYSPN